MSTPFRVPAASAQSEFSLIRGKQYMDARRLRRHSFISTELLGQQPMVSVNGCIVVRDMAFLWNPHWWVRLPLLLEVDVCIRVRHAIRSAKLSLPELWKTWT